MTTDLETPWVEKYRPRTFNDIVSQNVAISKLKEFVNSGNMPHMIFTGPAGTGKTSTALIIARDLLKGENYYRNLLELNASDTVRMEYVREVLKDFVNQNMMIGENTYKLVILDEADNIPTEVQQALRRIVEKAPSNVKFILLCNYIDRIIDPIISRCAVFRFVNLSKESVIERLKYVVDKENVRIIPDKSEKFFDALYFISAGDLRKAINALQMSVALELLETLDVNEILKVSGFIDEPTLEKFLNAFRAKDFKKARETLKSIETLDSRNLIRQLIEVLPKLKIEPTQLSALYAFFGEIDYRISLGADEQIQLCALLAEIIKNTNM